MNMCYYERYFGEHFPVYYIYGRSLLSDSDVLYMDSFHNAFSSVVQNNAWGVQNLR